MTLRVGTAPAPSSQQRLDPRGDAGDDQRRGQAQRDAFDNGVDVEPKVAVVGPALGPGRTIAAGRQRTSTSQSSTTRS